MPGVLVRIRSLYSSLPKAERNVADFIQQNPERAPHRSVHEFARAGGVSVASVSRFVRKLGFSDFKEFKMPALIFLPRTASSPGSCIGAIPLLRLSILA